MFAGGGAKNRFLRKALEERFNIQFIVPQEPQLIGAIGAAWEAARFLRKK
jgi:activator of 2-hydroxyglutaryl-CoA dehydratase